MILSSCHDSSLNNDCHCCCHCHCHWHCHYMQRIYIVIVIDIVIICYESMYISSFLALPWLVLSCLEWTSITIVIVGMTLYDLVLHYIIISYLMFFYFISSADLFSILFYWIRFTVLFCIVSHTNEWFVSICLSICLFVRLCVYLYE